MPAVKKPLFSIDFSPSYVATTSCVHLTDSLGVVARTHVFAGPIKKLLLDTARSESAELHILGQRFYLFGRARFAQSRAQRMAPVWRIPFGWDLIR
jgi:hypothetical protein